MAMTLTLTCRSCGTTWDVPEEVFAHLSQQEAEERRKRLATWPLCRDCSDRWDIARCPDGREHALGNYSLVSDERDGRDKPCMWMTECTRCGVGWLEGLPA